MTPRRPATSSHEAPAGAGAGHAGGGEIGCERLDGGDVAEQFERIAPCAHALDGLVEGDSELGRAILRHARECMSTHG